MPLGSSRTVNYASATRTAKAPDASYTMSVTQTADNEDTVTIQIDSSLLNQQLTYNITGAANSDLRVGNTTGQFTTNGTGSHSFQLQIFENGNNIEFFTSIFNLAGREIAFSSNISTVSGSATVVATGGSISTVNGWTTHEFTTDDNFVITQKSTGTVFTTLVGGGGHGGSGSRFQSYYPAGNTEVGDYALLSGGGGGAGQITFSNLSVSSYAVTSYPVVIGTGGQLNQQSGNTSTFNSITATGGGYGSGHNYFGDAGTVHGGGGGPSLQYWDAFTTATTGFEPTRPQPGVTYRGFNWYDFSVPGFKWRSSIPTDPAVWSSTPYKSYLASDLTLFPEDIRISQNAGPGSLYDGGIGVVQRGIILGQGKGSAVGGGGAGAGGDGYANEDLYWAGVELDGVIGGLGGPGANIWNNYPNGTIQVVAKGGPGGDIDVPAQQPATSAIYGSGGTGAHAGLNPSETSYGTTLWEGGRGANGAVKISYVSIRRTFET